MSSTEQSPAANPATPPITLYISQMSELDRQDLAAALPDATSTHEETVPSSDRFHELTLLAALLTLAISSLPALAIYLCSKRRWETIEIRRGKDGEVIKLRSGQNEGCTADVLAQLKKLFPGHPGATS